MPYRYRCGLCRTTSRAHLTRTGAKLHGKSHRQDYHAGDHPDGEQILHTPGLDLTWAWAPTTTKTRSGPDVPIIVLLAAMLIVTIWAVLQ